MRFDLVDRRLFVPLATYGTECANLAPASASARIHGMEAWIKLALSANVVEEFHDLFAEPISVAG